MPRSRRRAGAATDVAPSTVVGAAAGILLTGYAAAKLALTR